MSHARRHRQPRTRYVFAAVVGASLGLFSISAVGVVFLLVPSFAGLAYAATAPDRPLWVPLAAAVAMVLVSLIPMVGAAALSGTRGAGRR